MLKQLQEVCFGAVQVSDVMYPQIGDAKRQKEIVIVGEMKNKPELMLKRARSKRTEFDLWCVQYGGG